MGRCTGLDFLAGQFTGEYRAASPQSPRNALTCLAKGKATCLHTARRAGGQRGRREHRHVPLLLLLPSRLGFSSRPQVQAAPGVTGSPPPEKTLPRQSGVR